MVNVGGWYLCIDDFQDRKYLEAVAKEIRCSEWETSL